MAREKPKPINEEITCREVAEWASAYLDEHVGEARKLQMALHLAACAGCGAYVGQIAAVRGLVRLLPPAVDSPAESEQARRAVAAELRRR